MDTQYSLPALMLAYMRQHLKSIFLFFTFSVLFAIVFYLNNVPIDASLYAFILCVFIGSIITGIDFARYYRRHKTFLLLESRIRLDIDTLPAPLNLVEEDYQRLILAVNEEKIRSITQADYLYTEMLDYYTLWAHQIKTPIFAMRLLLQEDQTDVTKELQNELFSIEQYVEMVLSFLKLDRGASDMIIKMYRLEPMVRQVIRKYAPLFIRKKIAIDLQPLDRNVITDEKWFVFAFEQIISNALKYTHTGKISIYLSENNELVTEDTGIGIAEEDIARVFDKGYTGYNGRYDKKATGIGLYLCRRILTNLSHTVTIESQVGQGTRVLISLERTPLMVE
ncbi:MAG: sensor histidine kinase [Lachnospiraceae bacterium]